MRRCPLLPIAVVLLAACGLPDDREPRRITADEAPIDLDESDDDRPAAGGSDEVTLYFVREGRLVPVDRAVDVETLQTAIQALLDGPTGVEEAEQLGSAILAETVLRGVAVDNNIGVINLGCSGEAAIPGQCGLLGVGGTDQVLLFAQLACTGDAVRGVFGVRFQQEGEPQQAPLADGPLTSEPVRCTDYRSLGPDNS
jgi:spore germination protein GerM